MQKISQSPSTISKIMRSIDAILAGAKTLIIVLHDNPDPDALASGFALKLLCEARYGLTAAISHGGMINRAENKSMVNELCIPLVSLETADPRQFDRIAVVDTQPGRGNIGLPGQTYCHLVFDHHANVDTVSADLVVYNKNIGATATLIGELLIAAGMDIRGNLATAIAYAIRTETLELQREASKRDIAMYLRAYPISSLRKFGAIASPSLPNSYFSMLSIALANARKFRHFVFVPIGNVAIPEIVAEMADLFLRRERVTWTLAMGIYNSFIYFSLRTTHYKGQAFKILQNILEDRENAGGHDTFAGGRIKLDPKLKIGDFERIIASRFAFCLGFKNAKWKPLLTNKNGVSGQKRPHSPESE